jgi:uncharacterized phosphosugar-binding protein
MNSTGMNSAGMNEAATACVDGLAAVLGELITRQPEAVERAAMIFADTIGSGGVVHVYDTGHMLGHELVSRTGGLIGFTRLTFGGSVSAGGAAGRDPEPDPATAAAATETLTGWVLDQRVVRDGDALLISSVSGVSTAVVALATQASQRGIPVVAVTSVAFSSALPPKHPSGRRLLDVADVVLDNLAPYGDAFLDVPGAADAAVRVVPVSGVAGAALMWAVVAQTTAILCARDAEPSVYPSINLPDGPTRVAQAEARYRELGR